MMRNTRRFWGWMNALLLILSYGYIFGEDVIAIALVVTAMAWCIWVCAWLYFGLCNSKNGMDLLINGWMVSLGLAALGFPLVFLYLGIDAILFFLMHVLSITYFYQLWLNPDDEFFSESTWQYVSWIETRFFQITLGSIIIFFLVIFCGALYIADYVEEQYPRWVLAKHYLYTKVQIIIYSIMIVFATGGLGAFCLVVSLNNEPYRYNEGIPIFVRSIKEIWWKA